MNIDGNDSAMENGSTGSLFLGTLYGGGYVNA